MIDDRTGAADQGQESVEVQVDDGLEVQKQFIPTPEAISQYLENVKTEEVATQLASVEGRDTVYQSLLEHEDDIREFDPTFSPDLLREQIDLVGETLQQKQRFMEDVQSPEKKGLFRRAWDKVKGFAKKHPIITTLLVLAVVGSGVAGGLYLSGALQLKQAGVAIETIKDFIIGADAANVGIGEMGEFGSIDGVPLGK